MQGALPGNSWSYNCRPIVEAGQALLVDETFQLDDNFTLVPTPGHSPCHCCVMIRSQGQQAIVTGDMMTTRFKVASPIGRPSLTPIPSRPRNRGGASLGQVADTGTFVLPIHFPNPTTGLVFADGDRFRYRFAGCG